MTVRQQAALLLSPLLLPLAVILGGLFYLRHVPLILPAETRYPALGPGTPTALSLRWQGITGYELSDGKTVILVDPTVTRPTLIGLLSRTFHPDDALSARLFPRADYILVKHAHYDHLADVPSIALRTGATVVGTQSTVNLALSRGVPKERTIVAKPGDTLTLGTFSVIVRAYRHSKVLGSDHRMVGTIPVNAGELGWWQYTQDGALSYRLDSGKASIWFAGPSTFENRAPSADSLVMGAAAHGFTVDRMKMVLAGSGAKRLFPAHYDNFFQPLSKGLNILAILDLDAFRKTVAMAAPTVRLYLLDHNEVVHLPADLQR